MTIPLTGTAGLFTRLGAIGKALSDIDAFNNTTITTDNTNIIAQYPNGTSDKALIDGINSALTTCQTGAESYMSFAQSLAQNTLNYMVFVDNPQWSSTDLQTSMLELIRQMKANTQSVLAMTVGVSSTANGSNNGNGVLVSTTYRYDGLQQEDLFAENIKVSVTSDSNTSSSLAGMESFSALGEVSESDAFAADWPLGSGGSASLSAIPATDNSNGNLLTNSDFENWTSNTPNNWTITVGTAGTQVLEATSQFYTGAASLNIVGDGTTLTALEQEFNASTGTLGNPTPLSLYAFNCWIKVDSTPAAGVLEFALVDENGTVVNDEQGNANSFTQSLTGISTSWVAVNRVFRTPYIMPSQLNLRVRLSTALTSGHNLYLDRLCMGAMTELYSGGPSFAIFSGSQNFYIGDYFTATTTNSRGTSGTLSTFQTLFDRLFDMRDLGLLLPSSGSPTIPDSLI